MKRRKQVLSLLLALLLLSCIPAAAFAADGAESGFRYQHDPRLNARAMEDIVADPAAVYGFRPSPEGSLAAYADADWSDPALVNGENGRGARIAYHESIQELYALLDEMTAAGSSTEEIARAVSAKRNELRLAAHADDPEGLEKTMRRARCRTSFSQSTATGRP